METPESTRLIEESWKFPPPLLEDMQEVWNGRVGNVSQHRLKDSLDRDEDAFLAKMIDLEKSYQAQVRSNRVLRAAGQGAGESGGPSGTAEVGKACPTCGQVVPGPDEGTKKALELIEQCLEVVNDGEG